MLNELLDSAWESLTEAVSGNNDAVKFSTLSTLSTSGAPQARTIVLRELTQEREILFYTDARSPKCSQIAKNPSYTLLCYNHDELTQLRISGEAGLVEDRDLIQSHYKEVSGKAKQDYTTTREPGTEIKDPTTIDYLPEEEAYFAIIRLTINRLEYLQLKRPNHLRAAFLREDNWKGQWLVP